MRDIATALRPHAWVNVHSGMEGLFMPYDHIARMPDGADAAASLAVLQELNRTACGGRCVVGSGGESVGSDSDLVLLSYHCQAWLELV